MEKQKLIYVESKALFSPSEVSDKAIVFIKDTKEIWTHGVYFSCRGTWATPITLSLTGDTTGSVSIDGSGNASIKTTTKYLLGTKGIDDVNNAATTQQHKIAYYVNVNKGTPNLFPTKYNANGILSLNVHDYSYTHLLGFSSDGNIYHRRRDAGTWETTWKTILSSSNYTNFLDSVYLKKSGGTMTGALNFANNTWNKVGDNAYMGDCNVAGMIGIKGSNAATPGFAMYNNSGTLLGKLYASDTSLYWSNAKLLTSADSISIGEAYLAWGGKNLTYNPGPIDVALAPSLGANRLAFLSPDAINIEYSQDGGTTWLNYNATDAQKVCLFYGGGNYPNFYLGGNGSKDPSIDRTPWRLRITISVIGYSLLCLFKKFLIYTIDIGNTTYCLLLGRKYSDYQNNVDTWVTFLTARIAGWSGWNTINHPNGITLSHTANYAQLRFEFYMTSLGPTGMASIISRIEGFAPNCWSTPSNMASYGSIYSYDWQLNVIFPAQVTATGFSGNLTGNVTGKLTGNADTASFLKCLDKRYSYPALIVTSGGNIGAAFMTASKLGLSEGSYYDAVILRGHTDSSGGQENALLFGKNTSSVYHSQYAFGSTTTWGTMYKFLDSNNYSSYALPLSGGTLTGILKSTLTAGSLGTSPIVFTGNAASTAGINNTYSHLASNLATGGALLIFIGKASSLYNGGSIGYWHKGGDESSSNALTFGLFSANNLMVIQGNGNVGINNTSPSYKLDVGGDIYSSGYVRAKSGFIKTDSSDSYVLLGGGDHKLLSDFVLTSSLNNYVTLSTDLTVSGKKLFNNQLIIRKDVGDTDSKVIDIQHDLQLQVRRNSNTHSVAIGVMPTGAGVIWAKANGIGYNTLYLNPHNNGVAIGCGNGALPNLNDGYYFHIFGSTLSNNSITATKFIKSGGTSSQFLKADGSLDSTSYLKVDGTNGTSDGVSTLLNKLTTGTATPVDADYYICQYAGGGTTTTSYVRRPVSALYTYIKNKLSLNPDERFIYATSATSNQYGTTEATGSSTTLTRTLFWRDNDRTLIGMYVQHSVSINYGFELASSYGADALIYRRKFKGTWETPQTVLTNSNYTNYTIGYAKSNLTSAGSVGVIKDGKLHYNNALSFARFYPSDNYGRTSYELIAELPNYGTETNTSYITYGISGFMWAYREGNGDNSCSYSITAIVNVGPAILQNMLRVSATTNVLIPFVVKYNDKYYIALRKNSSSTVFYFMGFKHNLLTTTIIVDDASLIEEVQGPGTETSTASTFYNNGSPQKYLHAGNYNNYSPTLTGTGASGTWAISISGVAASANKVANALTVQLNGGTTAGTNKFVYDGSSAYTINITPAAIGASATNHTHSYLPLYGGILGSTSATETLLQLMSSTATLRLLAYSTTNYIQSSNADSTGNANLNITGYYGSTGSNLHLNFTNIYCRANSYTNIDSGNYNSYALPLSGGTLTGTLISRDIRPSANVSYSLGTSSYYYNYVYANYFKKNGSSDSYVLLGGGGHKAVSDFAPNNVATLSSSGTGNSDLWTLVFEKSYPDYWYSPTTMFYIRSVSAGCGILCFYNYWNSETQLNDYEKEVWFFGAGKSETGTTFGGANRDINDYLRIYIDKVNFKYCIYYNRCNDLSLQILELLFFTVPESGEYISTGTLRSSFFTNSTTVVDLPTESSTLVRVPIKTTYNHDRTIKTSKSIYASSFYENSDIRLKENVRGIDLSDLTKLVDLVQFNFKDSDTKKYGVIALLLEQVGLQNLVYENDGKKAVDYISLLVLEIQRLRNEIGELKLEINKKS